MTTGHLGLVVFVLRDDGDVLLVDIAHLATLVDLLLDGSGLAIGVLLVLEHCCAG